MTRTCWCCKDSRLLYDNGPLFPSVCEDCDAAGCDDSGCKVDLRHPPSYYRGFGGDRLRACREALQERTTAGLLNDEEDFRAGFLAGLQYMDAHCAGVTRVVGALERAGSDPAGEPA